ncbi:MAG: Tetraacyldisaccharide 4'-kinase (EC [uncultured Aureispira sp.]|uniref:Tetraacyldisaccharide 4'-kinase n=1 Tax=uncultured Aureispira sp. TaxID=1331704 RepID=A0A6S6UA75_9BACT|nr:MAG: Tetraacyldisaccharide 4'-kinase (EC [uncultured Aureispira sp.]
MKLLRLILCPILYPISLLYGSAARLHRRLYSRGILVSKSFDLPIINVGNLSVGGTGKSPHVAYFNELLRPNFETAIVSRGYHRKTKGVQLVLENSSVRDVGDEPLQLKQQFPNTTVVVAEHRAAGIEAIVAQNKNINCIVLDDAFQHWAIQAKVGILLTTFDQPFFEDWVLPMGRLREFRKGYQRADIIIVTKCPPSINEAAKRRFIQEIKPLPQQAVFFSYFQYQSLYQLLDPAKEQEMREVQGQKITLVTAIANTNYLEAYLESYTSSIVPLRFLDHHYYTKKDLEKIKNAAKGGLIITTEKDAPKLRLHQSYIREAGLQIYVLPIKVRIAFEEAKGLEAMLLGKI